MTHHALAAPAAPPFSTQTRTDRLAELDGEAFDVLVIGAGITGAGIARDAAMRGLRVALVDKGDIGGGTSSASSKLVHGGLRYLEHRELGLVFESVNERARLGELAPHLVRPLPFVFPVRKRHPRPLWMVALGLSIYELLALFRVPRRHQTMRRKRAAAFVPGWRHDDLDGAVLYWDCATDDARLTLATARAAHEAGAWVLPYVEVDKFAVERARVSGATLRDRFSGARMEIEARLIINATGPWTDRTLGLRRNRTRLLRPTKGVHAVIPADRLPIPATITFIPPGEKTFTFAIPAGERVFLGTTDTDYDGDYDSVNATREEIDYLLDAVNDAFPEARLTHDDVVGTWAGLRPLVSPEDDGLRPQAVSREHLIQEDDDGLITVAGGKLTTYRRMAAEVVDLVAERLQNQGMHVGRCPTASVLLPGGHGVRWEGQRLISTGPHGPEIDRDGEERFGAETARHLRETYGGIWTEIADRAAANPSLGERIVPDLPYLWAEVDHACEEEMAVTLEDVLRRRTQIQIRDRSQGREVAPAVAERMAELLGWDAAMITAQLEHQLGCAQAQMAWRLESDPD